MKVVACYELENLVEYNDNRFDQFHRSQIGSKKNLRLTGLVLPCGQELPEKQECRAIAFCNKYWSLTDLI